MSNYYCNVSKYYGLLEEKRHFATTELVSVSQHRRTELQLNNTFNFIVLNMEDHLLKPSVLIVTKPSVMNVLHV